MLGAKEARIVVSGLLFLAKMRLDMCQKQEFIGAWFKLIGMLGERDGPRTVFGLGGLKSQRCKDATLSGHRAHHILKLRLRRRLRALADARRARICVLR